MLLALSLLACQKDPTEEPIEPYDPLEFVDPFIATGGSGAEVTGVSPAATVPFGMTLVGPDTRHSALGAPGFFHFGGYWWGDDLIDGFSHTHSHGMGVNDYGGVLVMPRAAWNPSYKGEIARAAPFSHDAEWASPGRYAVDLQDDGTHVEIVATTHGAHHVYTFPAGSAPTVIVDLGHTLGEVRIGASDLAFDLASGTVSGYQLLQGAYSGRFGGVQTHFTGTLDPLPVACGTWTDGGDVTPDSTTASGTTVGGWLVFPEGTTEVQLRIALSYVDEAGATANFDAELPDLDQAARLAEAEHAWRTELGRVRVRGGTESERRIFHTALYHASIMPSRFADVDGRYRGVDGQVHEADFTYYTDLSLWDTFRTLHPWYVLAQPERQLDLVRTLVRMTEDGGAVPRWPLGHGYTGGMVGTPADQVFAETWLKGQTSGWDVDAAFEASYAHATGPVSPDGRGGITQYRDLGYVPMEAEGASASKTLEYAWSDHALSLWARDLGHAAQADELAAQAGNWRNVWDPDAGFFRARHADGSFEPFEDGDEIVWASDYTEGDSWHYLYYVPYDVPAMAELQSGSMGSFLERYAAYWEDVQDEEDDFFPDDFYWHGNEPVMHNAFVGSLAGDPNLTAIASRWVLSHRYWDEPRGLDGNDDSGTLSAWYLFAAIGVFPVAGTPDYAVASPIFERVEIDRPEGMLVVRAPGASPDAPYVQAATLGDEPLTRAVLTHQALLEAGELVLEMGEAPADWVE